MSLSKDTLSSLYLLLLPNTLQLHTATAIDPLLDDHPLATAATVQEAKASVQSKTKKLFSQSGLESFFKKSSLKVGFTKETATTDEPFDRIKVHGERRGAGDVASRQEKRKFTGQPQLDCLLQTIIDYILRDFLHSWFQEVSTDKEFVDVRTKQSIEETIGNVCQRFANHLKCNLFCSIFNYTSLPFQNQVHTMAAPYQHHHRRSLSSTHSSLPISSTGSEAADTRNCPVQSIVSVPESE